jgi:hypothetical protein
MFLLRGVSVGQSKLLVDRRFGFDVYSLSAVCSGKRSWKQAQAL